MRCSQCGSSSHRARPAGCCASVPGGRSQSDLPTGGRDPWDPAKSKQTRGPLGQRQAAALQYRCSCCNDLPLKVSFMVQENIQHGSLPGEQSMPSRQLSGYTKLEHKTNELAGFCPFRTMCQSTISGTG